VRDSHLLELRRRQCGRYVRRALLAAVTLVVTVGVTSCSDNGSGSGNGNGKEPEAARTPASRICDGTLDKAAVAALKRLGGRDSFQELTGKTSKGEPNAFSLSRAAAHLHDGVELRSRCSVYVPGSYAPLVQVDFKAMKDHPTKEGIKKVATYPVTFYPMGVYATTSQGNSTVLYFRCPTKGAEGDTPYVDAGIFSSVGERKEQSTSKDRMTILNSVSRRLADKLGCADAADLPPTVPDGEVLTP
jgi:hypothetical protein